MANKKKKESMSQVEKTMNGLLITLTEVQKKKATL
jgi:hypothetical protein